MQYAAQHQEDWDMGIISLMYVYKKRHIVQWTWNSSVYCYVNQTRNEDDIHYFPC